MILKEDMRVIGGRDEPKEPRQLFRHALSQLSERAHTVVVTQDGAIAAMALALERDASASAHPIHAIRIGELGILEEWRLDRHNWADYVRFEEPFERSNHARSDSGTFVMTAEIPKTRDVVLVGKQTPLRLTHALGHGGEGVTYATERPETVCKIYSRGKLRRATVEKLRLMVSRRIEHRAVCWPTSLAYSRSGQVVGYAMPRAEGVELAKSVFIKPLFLQRFPDWSRAHLVELAIAVVDAVLYVHSLNVLIGDINSRNILVRDEGTISFVDCDSFQVEGFPCPVGAPPFLSARLAGCDLRSTLRSSSDENFAIATLIFMILLPGKPPYSHEGGGDPFENVRARVFPYQLGDVSAEKAPKGPWRYMFSHLPYRLKEMFHEVFREGEDVEPIRWYEALLGYRDALRRKHLSADPFPTSL